MSLARHDTSAALGIFPVSVTNDLEGSGQGEIDQIDAAS
jgi:hypothetical protein